jgi:hypothetical protein
VTALAVLVIAGLAFAASVAGAPLPSGHFVGYVWRSGPVHEVHATWTVPRVRPHSSKRAVVGTWIAAQGGRPGPFIQVGTTASRPTLPGGGHRNVDTAFWSDPQRHFAPITLFSVGPGDVISASLTLDRGRWRVAIVDATSGRAARFYTHEEAGGTFKWAEWLQEDPIASTGRAVPYPRLTSTHFRDLGVNWTKPGYASVYSQWLTARQGDFAPTALAHDSFAIVNATLAAAGGRYLRIVSPEDAASSALYAQFARAASALSRARILAAGSALAVAARRSALALARHDWPTGVHQPIRALLRALPAVLSDLRALAHVPRAGLAAWNAGYLHDERAVTRAGHRIRRLLHVPEMTHDPFWGRRGLPPLAMARRRLFVATGDREPDAEPDEQHPAGGAEALEPLGRAPEPVARAAGGQAPGAVGEHREADADRAERQQLKGRVPVGAIDEGRQDRREDDETLGVGDADSEPLADRCAHAPRRQRAGAEQARERLAVADLGDAQIDQVGGAAELQDLKDGV